MRIDVMARRWGGPLGGPDGMAIAAARLAWTLCELGHQVRAYPAPPGPARFEHPLLTWGRAPRPAPELPIDFTADLVITPISNTLQRSISAARQAGALERLVFWLHHGGIPADCACTVAAPPAVPAHVALPPSSWAAELGGELAGDCILVPGAGLPKGGHVAREVAKVRRGLRFLVLRGRCSHEDLEAWRALPNAEVAELDAPQSDFLARTRAVLAPTRGETYGLTLVEAAVRGAAVVCSDLPGPRSALGDAAIYVDVAAHTAAWSLALDLAHERPSRPLVLRPYADVVRQALAEVLLRRSRAM